MERSSLIKLLDEYKNMAIQEHYKECKVQASLLISDDYRQAMLEIETACNTITAGLQNVTCKYNKIIKNNALPDVPGQLWFNALPSRILERVVDSIATKIRHSGVAAAKEKEICNKFDAAIKAAKASKSPARLKELADALGIETPEITVDTGVKTPVDTEFVREKIKAVSLLK